MPARSWRPPPRQSSSRPRNRTAPGISSRRSCPTNPLKEAVHEEASRPRRRRDAARVLGDAGLRPDLEHARQDQPERHARDRHPYGVAALRVREQPEPVGRLLHRSGRGADQARPREEAREADQGRAQGVRAAHAHPAPVLERGRPDRRDHDGHAHPARECGLLADLLRHGRAVHREEGEEGPNNQDHERQPNPGQQGLAKAPDHPEEAAQAEAPEVPHPAPGFQALIQGQVEAYTNDGIQLAGLKAKAANPALWEIVGDFYSYEPYGMAMRKNDSDFRGVVNAALMDGIENGKYFELYDKWFGAKGELPYPMSAAVRTFMLYQVVPK